jgi:Holliday junction resolvase RusA-like endonuclease
MKFTIVLEPQGQKRARGTAFIKKGKAVAGKPRKDTGQVVEENKLLALMYSYRPSEPLHGPVLLGVRAFLPIPPSKSKKWQAAALAGEIRPIVKPDLDNCIKHLKDVCKGVFWDDDKQVIEYLPGVGKYYGAPARWEIEIVTLEEYRATIIERYAQLVIELTGNSFASTPPLPDLDPCVAPTIKASKRAKAAPGRLFDVKPSGGS